MDKKIAAEKIRALLEGRIARLLGCDVGELHSMKIGSMQQILKSAREVKGGKDFVRNIEQDS